MVILEMIESSFTLKFILIQFQRVSLTFLCVPALRGPAILLGSFIAATIPFAEVIPEIGNVFYTRNIYLSKGGTQISKISEKRGRG